MADITLTLNDEEQKALAGVIDMALRHSGIGAADVAAHFIGKLRVAANGTQTAPGAPSAGN